MQLTHTRIDLDVFTGGPPPHAVIPRLSSEQWLVAHAPVRDGGVSDWARQTKEGHVYIPVFPYLLQPAPELAIAYAMQLGLLAGLSIGQPVRRLHLVIGSPVNSVQADAGVMLQLQLGFGVVVGS